MARKNEAEEEAESQYDRALKVLVIVSTATAPRQYQITGPFVDTEEALPVARKWLADRITWLRREGYSTAIRRAPDPEEATLDQIRIWALQFDPAQFIVDIAALHPAGW